VSGRVLPFEGSAHEEAQRLLPWLVNGRPDTEEASWLSSHVETCDGCRRDLEMLRSLQAYCLRAPQVAGDVDAGWKRMHARLDSQRAPQPARARPAGWWHARPRWQPLLLAAQGALLVMLALALWRVPKEATQPAPYRTLGATAPPAQLVVVFDGDVREARLRRLLQATGARIVDGPNLAGAYTLAVPPDRVASVRDALQASPDVVLVERLNGEALR
jgi:hypothetical protein